ncbi:hypothetical protein JL722_10122 [Aureococcus anophagefferens]|nr:hypothetical protein JL722_10122 [Aureococcus anophagefferens]
MMDRCLLALLATTNAFAPPTSHVHTPSIRSSAAESLIEDDGFALARHRQNPSIQRRLFGRQPGTLILVRHGESTWNANSTFTGWADVDLCWILLRGLGKVYSPVFKSWRLNERHYGALTGLSKPGLALELGEAAVPATESLSDTMARALPLWDSKIKPDLLAGRNVMVVAHGNSLRGLVKHIDGISDDEITSVSIPNGIPLVYKFERTRDYRLDVQPFESSSLPADDDLAQAKVRGEFLEKRGLLRAALQAESELKSRVPGALSAPDTFSVRALKKLELERKLIDLAGDSDQLNATLSKAKEARFFPAGVADPVDGGFYMGVPGRRADVAAPPGARGRAPDRCLVILRHGKTEHNKLGLFTGWEDAGLAPEGRAEASLAGRLLRAHGFELDMVYTSWLSRAIETAWITLSELDSLWIPIVKTWRLNERMYGALTGLSKKMIAQLHGEDQFREWRRSYRVRPPRASSFSPQYPGNDDRYQRYVNDVRYSFGESIIRTISARQLVMARKVPHTESLKDCMDRTIPYFEEVIGPSLENRTVLIASSENAIRGLLMKLCAVPEDRVNEVEIPTGLPLIYDLDQRCLRLLDDGKYDADPDLALARWNFGTAKDLLFRPCAPEDLKTDYCTVDGRPDPIIRLAAKPAGLDAAAAPRVDDNLADPIILGALAGPA